MRLAQRGRLERAARGVYRISHYPQAKLTQYREAVLWAGSSHHESHDVALSHETAFLIYGLSDVNPSQIHITIPKSLRLRRVRPKWITVHRAELPPVDITLYEGLPITTITKTVTDILASSARSDLAQQAVADARQKGYIGQQEAARLKRLVKHFQQQASETGSLRRKAQQ